MILDDIISVVAQLGFAVVVGCFVAGAVGGARRERRLLRGDRELHEPARREAIVRRHPRRVCEDEA